MLNLMKKNMKASSAAGTGIGSPGPVEAALGGGNHNHSLSSSTGKKKGAGVYMTKTEDEEIELSTSSQETTAAGSSPLPPRGGEQRGKRGLLQAEKDSGLSLSVACPDHPLDSDGPGTRSKEVWTGRRRCYTILVGIIFAAGVALVAITVTLFHQRGFHQNGASSSSSHPVPPDEQQLQKPSSNDTMHSAEGEMGGGQSATMYPTPLPTIHMTEEPSWLPSELPSSVPTSLFEASTTTFYAIGDVPYDDLQASQLTVQMQNIPSNADFVIHVGDLRNASDDMPCRLDEFERVASILSLSKVPVFVVLGDNDWNDCPNHEEGLQFWKREFLFFESRYWNHTFNISRLEGYDATFSFRHKRSLFIGLNLVGGKVLDQSEWHVRLRSQYNWTADLIREYRDDIWPATGRVVIMAHADPTSDHDEYFDPLRAFVQSELGDTLPILYLHGDKHKWKYQDSYLDQSYLLRIMVTGGSSEPPLKLTVPANGYLRPVNESFVYDRDLTNISLWDTLPTAATPPVAL
jgi:hypothetical protein